jgi:serine/threonine protein kinase
MVKTVGSYDIYRTIGVGSYGKVKFAVHRDTKEEVAIKVSWRYE